MTCVQPMSVLAVHNMVAWQRAWQLIAMEPHEGKGRNMGLA